MKYAFFKYPSGEFAIAEIQIIDDSVKLLESLPDDHPSKEEISKLVASSISTAFGLMFSKKDTPTYFSITNIAYSEADSESKFYNFEEFNDPILGKIYRVKNRVLNMYRTVFTARQDDIDRGAIIEADSVEAARLYLEVNYKNYNIM